MSDSEEEIPLRTRQRSRPIAGSLKEESSSEDDALTVQKAKTAKRRASSKQKPPSPLSNQDSDASDDVPIKAAAKRKRAPNGTNAAAKKRIKKEQEERSSVPKARGRAKKPKAMKDSTTDEKFENNGVKSTAKRLKKERSESIKPEDDEDADQEESFKWWEAEQQDGTQKWTTLSHNGVLFPPAYEPLPKDVKMLYDGVPVDLPLEAEEVAGFFGAMLETDHAKNSVFRANFFNDFLEVLDETGGCNVKIKEFERCDFRPIYDYYEVKRLEKKNMTSAEKKAVKAEKDKTEEKYKTCLLDGRKELVGNFRIEPPGLFRGRGKHPKTGKLKKRVLPEQVTLNIGSEEVIPEPPAGHSWAEVKHDNTVSWLATWKENINGATKYVFLAANSSLKGMSDMKKFEKARELKKHVDKIRSAYRKELKDPLMAIRQRATAIYLIDVFALRAGGEKGEDEADTVGCCSLRYEHVTLSPPHKVTFDFLGKDSIRFHQEVDVDPLVFKNLKIFKKEPKGPGDDIFDRLDPPTLNKYLQSYMPGLTAKVFRTYNASITMQRLIDKIPNEGSVNEKFVAFNAANREVAILCNHQRTVAKTHEAAMEKIEDKINEIRWNIQRHKSLILQLDKSQAKKRKDYFAPDPVLDKATVKGIKERIIERERVKIQKKFAKDNEKLVAEGEKPMPEKELKERLKHADELDDELSEEMKTGNMQIRNGMTVEKAEGHISKLQERLDNTNWQKKDKQDNSTVALTTSKINYIDPRLTVMYSKRFNVPLEKLFSKTLREKFNWAVESADENWSF